MRNNGAVRQGPRTGPMGAWPEASGAPQKKPDKQKKKWFLEAKKTKEEEEVGLNLFFLIKAGKAGEGHSD